MGSGHGSRNLRERPKPTARLAPMSVQDYLGELGWRGMLHQATEGLAELCESRGYRVSLDRIALGEAARFIAGVLDATPD